MAQGTSKLAEKQKKANKKSQNMKKGKRVIPPKKSIAIKQQQATKVRLNCTNEVGDRLSQQRQNLSGKITRSIEQQAVAAASSGKLTIMKHAALNSKGQRVPADPLQPLHLTTCEPRVTGQEYRCDITIATHRS